MLYGRVLNIRPGRLDLYQAPKCYTIAAETGSSHIKGAPTLTISLDCFSSQQSREPRHPYSARTLSHSLPGTLSPKSTLPFASKPQQCPGSGAAFNPQSSTTSPAPPAQSCPIAVSIERKIAGRMPKERRLRRSRVSTDIPRRSAPTYTGGRR